MMRKLTLAVFMITFFLMFGIPLWVLKGYNRPAQSNPGEDLQVRVLDGQTGKILTLNLEDYLVGVVSAEMPADFSLEALKAQAVAARTYTVKRMFRFGAKAGEGHEGAELCTDPTHCQAWSNNKELKKRWGAINYYIYHNKVAKAVNLTKDQIITYNNQFIDPVYHGSCGGKGTENSEDVWSEAIPYLRSVDCVNEYKAAEQVFSVNYNPDKLKDVLSGAKYDLPTAKGVNRTLSLKAVTKSDRGRIKEITVNGKKMAGIELRRLLGLKSTFLFWHESAQSVSFTSVGKGHAVGMCQYGANGLAMNGHDYREILNHYYTGVKIEKIKY